MPAGKKPVKVSFGSLRSTYDRTLARLLKLLR